MEAMELMDPKRRRRHDIMLFVGYSLIGVAILLITIILIFVAYGFGYQNGHVIQNGLVFLSSTPNPAQIYINNERYKNDTNTKLILPAGTYNFTLQRDGYRDWTRKVTVDGGTVQSYVYPLLFPDSLTTNTLHDYSLKPIVATQSPDHRWLLVANAATLGSFDEYDLTAASKQPQSIALPTGLLSSGNSQSIQVVAWAADDVHVLLLHHYAGNSEYILLNRSQPTQSVNITTTLRLPATGVDLRLDSQRYDSYLVLNTKSHALYHISLTAPTLVPYIAHVLAYAVGGGAIVYTTPSSTDAGEVETELYNGHSTYTLRHDLAGGAHLLDIASYNGSLYVAVSATRMSTAYIYKDPAQQITNQQLGVAVPQHVLRLKSPTFMAFSPSGQYVVLGGGSRVATYDVDNDEAYTYTLHGPIDAPQAHLAWMDGARLDYISSGQVIAVDYDGSNRQVLVPADPHYQVIFDQQYKFMYTFQVSASDKTHELLTSTSLRTPADQ